MEGLETVAVAARGKTVLGLRFTAAPEESRIAFAGTFNGKPCSPLYAPVWPAAAGRAPNPWRLTGQTAGAAPTRAPPGDLP